MGSLLSGSGGQTTSRSGTSSSSTNYTPEYNAYVSNILKKAQGLGDRPFNPYDISKMFAGFSGDQQQAFDTVRQNQGAYQPYFNQAQGALNRASSVYDPNVGMGYIDRAGQGPTPYDAGAGYLRRGAQNWGPRQQSQYSNQFAEGAIGRANDISSRNFLEKTMPGINDQFVKSGGGLGRGRYTQFMNRAVRDLGNEQSGNAQTTMANNYWQGANQFNTDMARQGQTGMNMGALSGNTMSGLANLGQAAQGVTTGAVNTGTGLANAYGTSAGQASNTNLQNTNALLQAGNLQQTQAQKPLTAQYQQFQQEQQWPFQLVNFMNQAQQGLRIPTTQTGQYSDTTSMSGGQSGSPMSGIVGGLGAIGSLFTPGAGGTSAGGNILSGIGDFFSGGGGGIPGMGGMPAGPYARGGPIRRFAQGGPLGGMPGDTDGVLAMLRKRLGLDRKEEAAPKETPMTPPADVGPGIGASTGIGGAAPGTDAVDGVGAGTGETYAMGGPALPQIVAPTGALTPALPRAARKSRAPLAARPDRTHFSVGGTIPVIRGMNNALGPALSAIQGRQQQVPTMAPAMGALSKMPR